MSTYQYTIPQLQSLIETEERHYLNPVKSENDFSEIKAVYNKVRELKILLHTRIKLNDKELAETYN